MGFVTVLLFLLLSQVKTGLSRFELEVFAALTAFLSCQRPECLAAAGPSARMPPTPHNRLGLVLYVGIKLTEFCVFTLKRVLFIHEKDLRSYFLLFVCFETGFLSGPAWPQTHRDPPASASRELGLKLCATTARL